MTVDRDQTDIAMVFDERGNALDGFDYTADELERRALQLRRLNGEVTTVTVEPSPFLSGLGETRG